MRFQSGRSYAISYTSESGFATERTIDILETYRSRAGVTYLKAWCRLRGEERTFRADRVDRAEEVSAGESFVHRMHTFGAARPVAAVQPAAAFQYAAARPAAFFQPTAAPCPSASPCPVSFPPPSAAFHPSPAESRGGDNSPLVPGFLTAPAKLAVFVLAVIWLASDLGGAASRSSRFTPPPAPAAAFFQRPVVPPKALPSPAPRPAPSPSTGKIVVNEDRIGGCILLTTSYGGVLSYEVPSLKVATRVKAEAVAAIRYPRFVSRMGFTDNALMKLYLAADTDGSGRLSFDELEEFQRKTYREFRYAANDFALRPDRFLLAGGGDCEDFALYTAGLLRFWGWDPYIASFGPASGNGHAVCFSYEAGDFPSGYMYYRLDGAAAEDGTALKAGRYVPIDYEHVGGLSDAVERRWKLRAVYIPEKIWGWRM